MPVRHNEVCKLIYNALIKLHHPEQRYQIPTPIWSSESLEIWWEILIKTIPKIPHNRPDIVVWRKNEKTCYIIDICIPLDENIHRQEKEKVDRYTQLKVSLIRLYPQYTYEIIPIVLGATGLVTRSLTEYLKTLGFDKNAIKSLVPKLQLKALTGSMRVMKSAMTMTMTITLRRLHICNPGTGDIHQST